MIARDEPKLNVVFHQAALGDFVLLWPMLRAIKSRTVVVSNWSKAQLAAEVFEHVEPMDGDMLEFTRLFAEGGPTHVSPMVEDLFTDARRIISFLSTGDDAWANNVRRLTPRATHYFVRPRPANDWTQHVTQWHEAQLAKQQWDFKTDPQAKPIKQNGPLLIHPGSGGPSKVWPPDRFIELIATLRKQGQQVRTIVGEVEAEKWPSETLDAMQAEQLNTLGQLAAAMREASGYLGNDAGPTHLAAQMGLPTTALFGPTRPSVWRPLGPAVKVLAPKKPCDMDWLTVEQVLGELLSTPRP